LTKFTIIVPVYNTEKDLERCLGSILEQTFRDYECLLIDDGSTDSSLDILREFAAKDTRFKVITQRNSGVAVARNNGIKLANGEYILFVDSDDWLENNLLSENIAIANSYEPDLIYFGYYSEFPNSQFIRHNPNFKYLNGTKEIADNFMDIFENNLFPVPWNKLYKTSFLRTEKILFPNTNSMEDAFMNFETFKKVNSLIINDNSYYHYQEKRMESKQNKFDENRFSDSMAAISGLNSLLNFYGIHEKHIVTKSIVESVWDDMGSMYAHYLLEKKYGFRKFKKMVSSREYDELLDLVDFTDRCNYKNRLQYFLIKHSDFFCVAKFLSTTLKSSN
jgi:glycosyltransferase involved in cell wall biosynthesis